MRHYRSDHVAQRLMEDLRVLIGAEALLRSFEGGQAATEALTLTACHAESAADHARLLIQEARQRERALGLPRTHLHPGGER
jgi:hypothetical protein